MTKVDVKKDPTYRLTKEGKVYRRGRKKFANLDVYDGEFLDGAKHGLGRLAVYCGDVYQGEFENNMFHGTGIYTWSDHTIEETGVVVTGKKYEGHWRDGKMHGKGAWILGKGQGSYSGEFDKGAYHGFGTLKCGNGDSFEGNWVRVMRQGKRHGKGRQTFGQGRGYYEGDWERDKPHGSGIRVYSNGSKFVGNLQDGEVHGDGTMFYANGDHFDGNFLNGFPYGEGKYTYSDGGYYDGEYKATKINKGTLLEAPLCNGKREGFGLRVFTNGSRYTGQWLDDKMHGQGQMLQAEGAGYEGAFFNGDHWHGKGEYVCCDGRLYSGEFQWGKKHGMGTQEYLRTGDQGDVYRQCIGGRGSMYRYLKYEGNWVDGVKEGHGTLFFVNTDTISGLFEHGQPHGLMKVTFSKSKRIRWARYERGTRMEWVKESKALGKATQAITMFHTEALVKAG
eukprot:GSChrysophyteH2.ASY1.ANO1.1766.1 assembled CDS